MAMERIFEKIKKSNHLPQLPQVMLQLVKACGSDKTNIEELTRIISTDPSLTSKLLQIIASPYVNLPKQVNTIKTAVVYLGLDTIRNIAISSSAMHFFKMSKLLPDFDITRFWYHSYKCGVLARRIAVEEGQANPDEFFLAGLLHDIGSLVLMRTFPKAYGSVLEAVNSGTSLGDAETNRFNVDTPQVSAWLFNQWQLNPVTSDAVLFMNEPLDRIQGELAHVKILYMANILSGEDAMARMDGILPLTDIPQMRLGQVVTEAEDEVERMAKSLGVSIETSCGKEVNHAVAMEIKDLSLFYGTLDTLLSARDQAKVLDTVQKGLKIVFHVPRVFFFLPDREKNLLIGTCHKDDRHYNIVRSIALPMDNPASLLVNCVNKAAAVSSFNRDSLAVSDTQIIRLLETRGLYCIPMVSNARIMGVMALGVDRDMAKGLDRNQGLLNLFSRQAGICMENIAFHQTYARDISEKKMEAYAALTDKVVHEINNPVSIIKNYLETLKLKLPENHPAQEELSVVGEEMYRVSSLLDGLSSYAKPKIGGLDVIDVNRTCGRVLEVLKKSILLPRQINTVVNFDRGLPEIKMDGNGLKQVLINLVKNAAEAMGDGGEIHVTTRLIPGSAKVLIDEKKKVPGLMEITIRDTGPGIESHVKDRLFEPYNSTRKNGRNSGLGLAIVHSIVKEMNGKITCDSREGEGTSFSVCLPLAPKSSGKPNTAGNADAAAASAQPLRPKETTHD
jgi:signal transduction histidine kinase/HD-like signal output (HDOD) protein